MMIESKYTIEYINPDESKKTHSKSHQNKLGYALGGLVLAALAYFLITLPTKKITQHPKVVISQQQPIKEKMAKVSKLPKPTPPLSEKVTNESASTKPLLSSKVTEKTNQANLAPDIKSFDRTNEKDKTAQASSQTEDLETLKAQLLDTQNRNKELATELDAQIMENMELATLLEDSLYKINKEDKSYIKELKKLEENTVTVTTKKKIINKALAIKAPIIIENTRNEPSSETKKTIIKNKTTSNFTMSQPPKEIPTKTTNRVDLSTASQIDAIIANIKSTNKPSRQTNLKDPRRGRRDIEASKVKLQTDINDMINNVKSNQFDKLQDSLNKI